MFKRKVIISIFLLVAIFNLLSFKAYALPHKGTYQSDDNQGGYYINEDDDKPIQVIVNPTPITVNPPSVTVNPPTVNVTVPTPTEPTKGDKGIMDKLGDVVKNVTDIGGQFVNGISNLILRPLGDILVVDVKHQVDILNVEITAFTNLLSSESLNSSYYNFARGLWGSIRPIGYSCITLFFIISFCKKTIYFEMLEPLSIYKSLLKLIVAKELVDYSYQLLGLIIDINNSIVQLVFGATKVANNTELIKYLDSGGKTDVLKLIFNFFKEQGFIIVVCICMIICYVMVVIRQIEIAVLSAVSPIFFSTFAGDSTTDIFVNFLKNFVAVTAQTIWMAVALAFLSNSYISSINVNESGVLEGFNFIVGVFALAMFIVKTPSSVKSAIGGTGGGGVNISDVTNFLSRSV